MGRDESASPGNERLELRTLAIRQRGNVGENQRLEGGKVLCIKQPIVHHLERHARFHQRMVPAIAGIVGLAAAHGVEVRAMTYGGIITVLRTPDVRVVPGAPGAVGS